MLKILPLKSWSIRWRLTAWYALSILMILIVAGTAAFYTFRETFIRETDRSLTIRGMQVISSAIGSELFHRGQQYVVPAATSEEVLRGFQIQFSTDSYSPVGDPIYMRLLGTLPNRLTLLSHNVKMHDFVERVLGNHLQLDPQQTVTSYFDGSHNYDELRVANIRVPRQPFVLQLATPWQRDQDALNPVISIIVGVVFFGFALSGVGGWILVGRTLQPITELVTEAEKTSGSHLEPSFVAARTVTDDEIGHLASALNQMMGRVHRAIVSQRQFTADASHDLRTPLAIIRGEIELALARVRSAEEYREVLISALEETERLIRIVTDLGELSNADIESEHRLHRKAINVRNLCSSAIQARERQAAARNIQLRLADTRDEPMICGDEMAIQRAIGNLIDNAINYNVPEGKVNVLVAAEDGIVKVSISDTGIGIKSEDLPHVFDRFYRGDKSRATNNGNGNAGLGLSIVRSVITAHDGRIWVESTINEGSTFTFTLPQLQEN